MSIKVSWQDVYESVVNVSHTGDVNWTTALTVTGKGIAEIQLSGSTQYTTEIRITLDGTVLVNGVPSGGHTLRGMYVYEVEYNVSLLIEYRVSNAAHTAYCLIHYKNR